MKKTLKKKGVHTKDDMRGLFFIVKGQYRKGVEPKVINSATGNETYIGGYNPHSDDTVNWYMLLDRKTFRCCACSNDLNKVVRSVHTIIMKYKGVARGYFKHISQTTSDDYYEIHYLGHKPLTHMEREKKGKNKYPRVSPVMRCLYEEVDKRWGDYYEDLITEMEDLAYEDLKGEKPVNKSRKLVSKHKVEKPVLETPKHTEVIDTSTPKKLVKPKVKMGVKKLSME